MSDASANAPLRVAVDASVQILPEPTGVERAQATLLDALAARDDCELHLLAPARLPDRWRERSQVHCHDERGGPIWFWRESVVPGLVRRHGAQLFHSPVAALPMRANVPLVATVHEAPWAEPGAVEGGDDSPAHRLRLLLASGLAARIVCPSQRTAAQVVQLYPDAEPRVRVVPHGLDAGWAAWRETAPSRAELARACGFEDAPFVLGVGRLRAKKAWHVLMDAIARDTPGVPRQLVIAGPDGDAADDLRARAEQSGGRVRLVGHVDEAQLAGLYTQAAVLGHPSALEGFGLTPLEALACGTPVVVRAEGLVPEGVGSAAVSVAGDDPDDWAAGLARALADDDESRARRVAADALLAERTADATAARLMAVWTELVPAGRAP